jgi:hypothetical protein
MKCSTYLKKKYLLLGLFLLPAISYAQIAITGTVADMNGEVIIGANVVKLNRFYALVGDGQMVDISTMYWENYTTNIRLQLMLQVCRSPCYRCLLIFDGILSG